MTFPFGLFSWLLAGLAAGLLAAVALPGRPRLSLGGAVGIGLAGAVAGGIAATVLGFGGLVGFDPRSLATAALAAVFFLLLLRTATLARP